MKLKSLAAAAIVSLVVLAVATPAFAHVTTDPASAPKGGEITLGFRVPNEEAGASTIQFEIDIPTDHPLLGIAVESTPGWTTKVTEVNLDPPVQTDDGPINQAVNRIVWVAGSGGGIAPGEFQEFHILVQTLPSDTDQIVFKALQTYSDGTVVRWIDPVTAGQDEPDHPTPILALTAPSSGTVDVSHLAGKSAVDSARTFGIIGLIVGGLGLLVALVAILTRPRKATRSVPGGAPGPNRAE